MSSEAPASEQKANEDADSDLSITSSREDTPEREERKPEIECILICAAGFVIFRSTFARKLLPPTKLKFQHSDSDSSDEVDNIPLNGLSAPHIKIHDRCRTAELRLAGRSRMYSQGAQGTSKECRQLYPRCVRVEI